MKRGEDSKEEGVRQIICLSRRQMGRGITERRPLHSPTIMAKHGYKSDCPLGERLGKETGARWYHRMLPGSLSNK
jgi:hypothetical protein